MSDRSDAAVGFEAGQKERPAFCTDEHLVYLDDLRVSGETNMFGARPYLMDEFPELTSNEAGAVLGYWMKSFGNPGR